eukprot:Tbor_TRINITY_DN5442_c1_g20::TRINITY_DN5442_c1_g20_i1::g.25151::m.25151
MLQANPISYGRFIPYISRAWLSHHLYGWKFAPSIAKFAYPYVYLKAILYIASADDLHNNERRYIQGLVEVLLAETDPDMMQFIEVYGRCDTAGVSSSSQSAQICTSSAEEALPENSPPLQDSSSSCAEVLPPSFISGSMLTSPVLSRVLLYDAVKAATADRNYTECERVHVYSIGKQLGIPESVTSRIETIAEREMILAVRKRALLLYGQTSNASHTANSNLPNVRDNGNRDNSNS